ncbi:hypothetical protein LCGC14_2389840, partial [marine sediment metagenome]
MTYSEQLTTTDYTHPALDKDFRFLFNWPLIVCVWPTISPQICSVQLNSAHPPEQD